MADNPYRFIQMVVLSTLLLITGVIPAGADVTLRNGGRLLIRNGAAVSVNCGDLTVGSSSRLYLGNGRIENCRNFTLESGAFFDDGTGTLNLNGTWSNDGSYRNSTPQQIRFSGTCSRTNSVVGTGDADGDHMSDGEEGLADSDGDGIVEFLDPNRPPSISAIGDLTIQEDEIAGPIAFTVSDRDRPVSLLRVTATSSNQLLIPDANITLAGSDENRTVTLVPEPEASGIATITITVSDRGTSVTETFDLIVTAVNDTPVITGQADVYTFETAPVTIGLDDLMVVDPDNAYPEDFTFTVGDGENYRLDGETLTAVDGFSGTLTVPVAVSDGNSQSDVYGLSVYIATRKTVDTIDDGGPGSLRQRIATSGPGDIIDLAAVSGTMVLTGGSLIIDHDLTLVGPPTAPLVLDGNDSHRVLMIGSTATVTIENMGITGGYSIQNGGGIANHGNLVLRNVAIYDNIAVDETSLGGNGGGISNTGALTAINCTVSGNAADGNGGGIFSHDGAEMFLTHCTLHGNAARMAGGNLYNAGRLHMVNSIVAGNVSGGEWMDSGTIATNSGNLVEDGSHDCQFSGDPLLGPLQDNGGPTVSHLPQSGSPALDAIPPADCPVADDQRGFSRMEKTGDAADIGAVEIRHLRLTVQSTGDGSGSVSVDDTVCGASCSVELPEGYGVTLSAVADDGFMFKGWSHPACANTDQCTLTLIADTTVQAEFGETDTDGDGLSDALELSGGTDPHDVDTDDDAMADGTEDANRNGAVDAGETDPRQADPGPGIPVLIAPQPDCTEVDPMAILQVGYALDDAARYHGRTRWQIGHDETFETLVMDVTTTAHLLQVTVPRQVLAGDGVYFWRVRFIGSDGRDRMWSAVRRFTTREPAYSDVNANRIPDVQEPPDGSAPFIRPPAQGGWRSDVYYLDIVADDGSPVHVAMQVDSQVSAMDFFGHVPSDQLPAAGDCPDDLVMGVFSMRLHLAETGGTARVRLYFSSPLPEDGQWTKYDSLNGWQAYSGFIHIDADRTVVTIDLVDGGYGDADGVANGIVVDPSGPTVPAAGPEPEPAPSGGGGGGCFIRSLW